MRRDGGRLHAGSRGSGEFNLHIAWHITCAAVSLILGERLDERDQVVDRMERRGRSRLVEEKDVGRERVHMATLQRVGRLCLDPAERCEDEIVSVAVECWNSANRLEILDPLEARRDARRAVTRMA